MNKYLRSFIFILLNICIIQLVNGQINISNNNITIANEAIRKEFTISKTKPGSIMVTALFDKINNHELLSDRSRLPWFEFVVNHELVTSNDPVWEFVDFSQRTMTNKGIEYTFNFRGVSHPVKGLLISVKEQVFPRSALIREKLILHVNNGNKFALNKYKSKLHFVFPQYAYKVVHPPVKSTEIRIATWDNEVLNTLNNSSYDSRLFDNGGDHNLSQAHMFHPKIIKRPLPMDSAFSFKGPLGLISGGDYTFLTAYEHASQDNISGQAHDHLNFLQIDEGRWRGGISSAVKIIRGGYLDGEEISSARPYESVWTATGFYPDKETGQPEKLLHNYLLKWITEFPQTRETRFYYNTWGMQRDEWQKGKDLHEVLNYDRLFKEIRYAHQLGTEIFVLDDGWQEKMGVWKPNQRLSRGFRPIYDTLKKYNMTLGLWMSPLAIDPGTERYKQHPGWVIKNKEGLPVKGQGNVPVFDFVSGFSDLFINDCKWLIDQGVRFFKWDAINSFYSYCTGGRHGNNQDTKEDIIARYGYLLPIYIKKAMTALMNYNPEVVIEIDLTENDRALMGLATISAGKLFFMNNGASAYGDYSQFRAKSMRTVANAYNGIIPLQLFTYADYPQNSPPFMSQRYNVNSSLICGRGFWGNLNLMNFRQRTRVEKLVNKAKMVSPFLKNTTTAVTGKVGASPEIYTNVNVSEAAGQVIAFSGSAINYVHKITLNRKNFLGVIDNAFELSKDTLKLYFQFPMPDASREAFILPNQHSGIQIISCTAWLDAIHLHGNRLEITCGAPGKIVISRPISTGYPKIHGGNKLKISITEKNNNYMIEMDIADVRTPVIIE